VSELTQKYLLDMMKQVDRLRPRDPSLFDPFRIEPPTFAGMRIHETPDVPVLQISPDFPYVSDKFRAEWNRWALERFGTRNIVPEGTAYMFCNRLVMNPRSVVHLFNAT
jgi:hypothetical protein